MSERWTEKAPQIIKQLCEESYRASNYTRGKKRAKHVPYAVPTLAKRLIDCMNNHDRSAAEYEAKCLFHLYYSGVPLDSDMYEAA